MKALIVDDEPLARQHLEMCLKKISGMEVVGTAGDGFEALQLMKEIHPDIIFLDIQMPRINGFEVLELLEEKPAIVFITAFDSYAIRAFEMNAVDYLLKPFSQSRLEQAIQKAQQQVSLSSGNWMNREKTPEEQGRIVLRHQGDIRMIPVHQIYYVEAYDDFVKIHTEKETFVKKQTLSYYETNLSTAGFVRCHRSYLVNTQSITAIHHVKGEIWEIRLKNGYHIQASKQGYGRLREGMGF